MEAAAVASSGCGLRGALNPAPNQHRRGARLGLAAKRQQRCAVACGRLLLRPNARVYTAASAVMDSGAGDSGVRRKRLAVFVSGGGSNFRSIHEAALGGKVNGDVVALVTDKPGDHDCLLPAALSWTVRWIGGSDVAECCRLRWRRVRNVQWHSRGCVSEVEIGAGGGLDR